MSATSGDRRTPWQLVARELAGVAAGRSKASLVIKGCRWVNVHTAEVIPNTDVAVSGSRIAYVGPDASHATGAETEVIEADGAYLLPGLCDPHMHVESGMVTVTEFCRAVMPHGTTSMFVDPHEIANVLGLEGVRLMHDEAVKMPIGVHVQVPSCVPSAPGLEDAGATLGPAEVEEALSWPGIVGLGEMMSFAEVVAGDRSPHAIMAATMAAGKVVGGHCPLPATDLAFHAYAASGPADDHEITTAADGLERARRGMKAMCRLGSAWYDVAETVRAITEWGVDARGFVLCTDDCHSGTLVNEGHMDRVVRHAISRGLHPVTAIQMATLNVADHFGMARDMGSIAPGRLADMILTDDLVELPIDKVFAAGRLVAAQGALQLELDSHAYPDSVRETVRIGRELAKDDFAIGAPDGELVANVIGVIENQAPTRALRVPVRASGGILEPDTARDLAQVTVIERHSGDGGMAHGLVGGFGFDCRCCVASTVMHDCHNLIVVGTDRALMALAANRLCEVGGGVTVWRDGEELALVELPIAGLMSDDRAENVAAKAQKMVEAMRKCGCLLNNAYMQLSLLGLAVIPEIRISNRGIVDVAKSELMPLFAKP